MKTTMLAAVALALAGCNGAFWGNLLVLGITVGIFLGTLALGRARSESTRSGAGRASSSSHGA